LHTVFTSESVTEGHPDKVADQISDGILDTILTRDPLARTAIETLVTTGLVLVAGEVTTDAFADVLEVAREVLRDIGYTRAKFGFDADTCAVLTSIHDQSPEIAQGILTPLETRSGESVEEIGAGDQGMVVGYATDETPEYMPLPIALAHRLAKRLADVRKEAKAPFLWPDGKTQVTVIYEDGTPASLGTVVVSAQHSPEVDATRLEEAVRSLVIDPVIPPHLMTPTTRILVNPSGRFVMGGPTADTGMTGRKIIVDTYGGFARHGGGAFSGKDPTKVDRSGAYAARWAAKNVVAAGLAKRVEIQIAYAIGVAKPVSVRLDTFGTGSIPDDDLSRLVAELFDFRPGAIIERLDLRRPIYRRTAAYGHFGRTDTEFSWERLDRIEDLLAHLKARR